MRQMTCSKNWKRTGSLISKAKTSACRAWPYMQREERGRSRRLCRYLQWIQAILFVLGIKNIKMVKSFRIRTNTQPRRDVLQWLSKENRRPILQWPVPVLQGPVLLLQCLKSRKNKQPGSLGRTVGFQPERRSARSVAESRLGFFALFNIFNTHNIPILVCDAVHTQAIALKHASKKLQDTKSIVLRAVSQDARALMRASEKLRGNRQVVLAAVNQNGFSIIKSIRKILILSFRQPQIIFMVSAMYASEELQTEVISFLRKSFNLNFVFLSMDGAAHPLSMNSIKKKNLN
jgi:hypothetical protein